MSHWTDPAGNTIAGYPTMDDATTTGGIHLNFNQGVGSADSINDIDDVHGDDADIDDDQLDDWDVDGPDHVNRLYDDLAACEPENVEAPTGDAFKRAWIAVVNHLAPDTQRPRALFAHLDRLGAIVARDAHARVGGGRWRAWRGQLT